jgi:hypothetical protein
MAITTLKRVVVVSEHATAMMTPPTILSSLVSWDYSNPQPQGFVPYTQPFGLQTRCVIKDAFIHISTSSFPNDVGLHNHPFFGPSVPAGVPHWACARSHHLRLGNGSDTICNDSPPMTQYCPLLAPQTRLPQRSPILRLLLQKHA